MDDGQRRNVDHAVPPDISASRWCFNASCNAHKVTKSEIEIKPHNSTFENSKPKSKKNKEVAPFVTQHWNDSSSRPNEFHRRDLSASQSWEWWKLPWIDNRMDDKSCGVTELNRRNPTGMLSAPFANRPTFRDSSDQMTFDLSSKACLTLNSTLWWSLQKLKFT